jgi:hypothetical protein
MYFCDKPYLSEVFTASLRKEVCKEASTEDEEVSSGAADTSYEEDD